MAIQFFRNHSIVRELLEGTSLRERIVGRPLPTDEVLGLGIDVADALDTAHAKGHHPS
jgi:hypothetical protein